MIRSKSFLAISISEFCDRFSFYGLQALLILYLMHRFHQSANFSYTSYGSYAALSFVSCIVGGFISDRFLTNYQSIMMGLLFMLIGNGCLLIANSLPLTFLGITAIILSVGLIKSSSSCLMGCLYQQNSPERNHAFLYYYMLGSIGSIIGPVLYGVGISHYRYWIGFLISMIIVLASVFFLMMQRNILQPLEEKNEAKIFKAVSLIILFIVLTYLVIAQLLLIEWIIIPATLFALMLLNKMIKQTKVEERHRFKALLLPVIASVMFITLLFQLFSSITLYINDYVNTAVAGWHIPITWISSSEALFIIIVTPIMGRVWKAMAEKEGGLTLNSQLLIGMFATGLAFIVFGMAALVNNGENYMPILLILVASVFLAIGEVGIIPTSISIINSRAPDKYKGVLMGGYYFTLSISGYFSGILAKLAPVSATGYTEYFWLIAFSVIVTCAVITLFMCLTKGSSRSLSSLRE